MGSVERSYSAVTVATSVCIYYVPGSVADVQQLHGVVLPDLPKVGPPVVAELELCACPD